MTLFKTLKQPAGGTEGADESARQSLSHLRRNTEPPTIANQRDAIDMLFRNYDAVVAVAAIGRKVANSARPNSATAPARKPSMKVQKPLRRSSTTMAPRRRRDQQRVALDHAAGDVVGDGVDDGGDVMRLGDTDAAEVVPARNGRCACRGPSARGRRCSSTAAARRLADAAIEQVDLLRDRANKGSSASSRISTATLASSKSTTTGVRLAA